MTRCDEHRRLNRHLAVAPSSRVTVNLLCECGQRRCYDVIAVTHSQYREARGNPGLLLIAAAHFDENTHRPVSGDRDTRVVQLAA